MCARTGDETRRVSGEARSSDGMFISFEPVSRSQQGEPKGLPSWTTLGLQEKRAGDGPRERSP